MGAHLEQRGCALPQGYLSCNVILSHPKVCVQMSQLITRRRSVTNAPPALSTSTTPGMSAPLIGEPTPFTEAAPTASQVPVSLTSSVSVQPLSARWPHRHRREPEPYDHTSSASRVRVGLPNQLKKTPGGLIEC